MRLTRISQGDKATGLLFFSVIRIMHILKLQGFIVIYVIDLLYIGLWAKLHPISCPCNTRLSFFFPGEKRNCLSSFSFDIIACPYSLKMFLTLVKGSYMSDWNSTLGPSQSKYIHVFWTFQLSRGQYQAVWSAKRNWYLVTIKGLSASLRTLFQS